MSGPPGMPGRGRRNAVAVIVLLLGLLDVALTLFRHPLIHAGPVRHQIPYVAVAGARYVLLAAGLALISVAPGLRHGKRQAWNIAMAAVLVSLAAHPLKRTDVIGSGATIAAGLLLVATARLFRARSDPLRARRGVAWLVFGELGVFLWGVIGMYFLDYEFVERTNILDALGNALRAMLILPATTVAPETRHGAWFIDSVRVMALLVLGIAAWHLLHPVVHRQLVSGTERDHVRRLLEQYATNTLAYFHLLDDKDYFFADDGEAFIGYKVVGHTAVVLGEPIGKRASCITLAQEFAEFCDLNGWAFAYHQVTGTGCELLRECGLNALKIGEEALIPLPGFSLSGKSFKHIRNVTNRLERDGYRIDRLSEIDGPLMDELEEISDAWLADGGHRERTFTLGLFDRRYLRETGVVVVTSPAGRIEAFVNPIPGYRSKAGNFDLMRRRPDAPEGVMDLLIVALAEQYREEGCETLALGLAPLANIEGTGIVERALRILYIHGGRAFNFQGLRAFKSKWKPVWEPRYLCYRSELQLPQIALAVVQAGELRSGHWWAESAALVPFRRRAPGGHEAEPAEATG